MTGITSIHHQHPTVAILQHQQCPHCFADLPGEGFQHTLLLERVEVRHYVQNVFQPYNNVERKSDARDLDDCLQLVDCIEHTWPRQNCRENTLYSWSQIGKGVDYHTRNLEYTSRSRSTPEGRTKSEGGRACITLDQVVSGSILLY